MIQVFHILSLQVDALVAAVAQLQANVREIQRTTTTANTAADEFDAVTISESECCIFSSCIFGCESSPISRNVRSSVSQSVIKGTKKAQ